MRAINKNMAKLHQKDSDALTTTFRIPVALLREVEDWCEVNDFNRSQFFRNAIRKALAEGVTTVESK